MIRSFLVEELKLTFLPGIATAAALTVFSFMLNPLFSRIRPDSPDIENLINTVVIFLMAVLISVGASATFGLSFRQGPLRLLENLPISRYRVWLSRLLVSILTMVAGTGLLVVAHPSIITNRADLAIGISFGCLTFFGGLCWGLVIQAGSAAVMLLNLVFVLPLMALLAIFSIFASGQQPWQGRSFALGAAFFCVAYLVVSFLVFMRGEFEVRRRSILNHVLIVGALSGTFVTLVLLTDAGALAYGEQWVPVPWSINTRRWDPSPDGRYLALSLNREFQRSITKVVVIDVVSGKIVKTFRQNAIRQIVWTQDGSLIALSDGTVLERFLGIGTEVARATRIFPDEQKLSTRRGSRWTRSFRTREWGTFATVDSVFPLWRSEGTTSLIQLDAPGGATEVLSSSWTSADHYPEVWSERGGAAFRIFTGRGRRAWIIGKTIRETTYSWGPFPLPDEAAVKEAQAESRKNAPKPSAATATRGVYLYSDSNTSFDKDGWLYFLEANVSSRTGRLLARRISETEWKNVLDGFPLSDKEIASLSLTTNEYSAAKQYRLFTGFYSGMVAGVYRTGGKARILVVNLVNGERHDIEDANNSKYGPGDVQRLSVVQDEDSLDIFPSRLVNSVSSSLPVHYKYTPGASPKAFTQPTGKRIASTGPAFSGPNGIQVYHDATEVDFHVRSADGTTRQLWPQ